MALFGSRAISILLVGGGSTGILVAMNIEPVFDEGWASAWPTGLAYGLLSGILLTAIPGFDLWQILEHAPAAAWFSRRCSMSSESPLIHTTESS
jgi:hypothetical protein